jgi:hypothetical protein
MLVIEAHQTFVARSLTIHLLIFARPAEVAAVESFLSDGCDGVGFLHEPPQNAGATLRSLIEKNRAVVIPPHPLRFDFAFVELERLLKPLFRAY